MYRVVLDSNVLVSAFATTTGVCFDIYEHWEKEDYILIISNYIIKELRKTLTHKIGVPFDFVNRKILALHHLAEMVIPADIEHPDILPNDWPILGTAVAASADFLVTGDKRILNLKNFKGTDIVSPQQFVKQL